MSSITPFPDFDLNKCYSCSYEYEVSFYDPDDSKISITPTRVKIVQKDIDYRDKFMSILKMQFRISKTDMFILKHHQKQLLASITRRCNKYVKLKPSQQGGEAAVSLVDSKIEFSGIFEPIFSGDAFDERYREEEYTNREMMQSNTETNVETETGQVNIDVLLMELNAMQCSKELINMVVKAGSTVGTLLLYLLDSLPANQGIIDTPDNDNSLPDAIIAPGALVPTLNYIQSIFGIYENGLLAFYDDGILYFLNKFALDHDCKKGDAAITHIYVTEFDKYPGGTVAFAINENNEPMYMGPIIVKVANNEVMDGELHGNNFVFSSFRQGLDAVKYIDGIVDPTSAKPVTQVLKRNIETHAYSGDKSILDYDELNNPFNMASYFNALEATSMFVCVQLDNMCYEHFTANKLVSLHFLDSNKNLRLGGVYHITTVMIVNREMKATSSELSCGGVISLCKRSREITG